MKNVFNYLFHFHFIYFISMLMLYVAAITSNLLVAHKRRQCRAMIIIITQTLHTSSRKALFSFVSGRQITLQPNKTSMERGEGIPRASPAKQNNAFHWLSLSCFQKMRDTSCFSWWDWKGWTDRNGRAFFLLNLNKKKHRVGN